MKKGVLWVIKPAPGNMRVFRGLLTWLNFMDNVQSGKVSVIGQHLFRREKSMSSIPTEGQANVFPD